jgi:hypothetical protein
VARSAVLDGRADGRAPTTAYEGRESAYGAAVWIPFPAPAGTQKSTSELSAVPEATPEQKRLYEATFRTAA